MRVSWQVAAILQDPSAEAHALEVEFDKPASWAGECPKTEIYRLPQEMGVGIAKEKKARAE